MPSRISLGLFLLCLLMSSEALLEDIDKKTAACVVSNRDIQNLEKEQLFFLGLTVRLVVRKVVTVNSHTFLDEKKNVIVGTVVNGHAVVKSESHSSEALVREGVHERIKNETNLFHHGLNASKIADVAKECFSSVADSDVREFNERLQANLRKSFNQINQSLNALEKNLGHALKGLHKNSPE